MHVYRPVPINCLYPSCRAQDFGQRSTLIDISNPVLVFFYIRPYLLNICSFNKFKTLFTEIQIILDINKRTALYPVSLTYIILKSGEPSKLKIVSKSILKMNLPAFKKFIFLRLRESVPKNLVIQSFSKIRFDFFFSPLAVWVILRKIRTTFLLVL